MGKKAGQAACKFARKAGISEHVAEHERDEAEKEAEHLEDQAEREADKAADQVDHVFAEARAAVAKKSAEAKSAIDTTTKKDDASSQSLNLLALPQALAGESKETAS